MGMTGKGHGQKGTAQLCLLRPVLSTVVLWRMLFSLWIASQGEETGSDTTTSGAGYLCPKGREILEDVQGHRQVCLIQM